MDSKPKHFSSTGAVYLLSICLLSVALPACKTVSSQAKVQPDNEQAKLEAELNAHADNAFAELDDKPKAKAIISPPLPTEVLQQATTKVKTHRREPNWVMTPPSSAEYVFGVGSAGINSTEATASQIADEQAKVNLVAKLRVSVSSVNTANEQLADGVVSLSFSSEVRSSVKEVSYTGLNIIERYVDQKDATVYSLAALHRQTTLDNLQQQINGIDQQLLSATATGNTGSNIQRLRLSLPNLKLLAQRKQLNQQAIDISNGQHNFALSPALSSYEADIYRLVDQLQFRVAQNGEHILRDSLIKALTDQGMRVSQQGNADIHINYRVSWRHIVQDGQHFQLANATVNLLDDQGKTLSTFIEKAKGISGNEGLAKDKALEKLALQLSQALGANLMNAID